MLKTVLSEQGLPPENIEGIQKALEMQPPIRQAFETEAKFDAALSEYASKWSALMGLGPSSAPMVAQQLKLASLASSGETEKALSGFLNFLPPDKAKDLSKNLLASDSDAEASLKSLRDNLSKMGLNSQQIDKFQTSVLSLEKSSKSVGLGLGDKTKKLLAASEQMGQALGLPEGASAKIVTENINNIKRLVWGSEDLGAALDQLAVSQPALAPNLPELHRLRTSQDLQPFNSLAEIAIASGVTEQVLLKKIGSLDTLNPVVVKLEIPAPEPEPEPEPEPIKQEAVNDTIKFTNRSDVEKMLLNSPKPDAFSRVSLAGIDLSKLDFSSLDLTETDFRDCDLTGASFNGANLTGAILQGANLNQAKAIKANFSSAIITEIKANETDFSQSLFHRADLSLSDLSTANLSGITATEASFTSTTFPKDLSGLTFSQAKFRGADLKGVNLKQANLSQADFSGCDLSQADLKQADLTTTSIVGTLLNDADLSGIKATGARFLQGCDLTGANLSNAKISGASFTGSKAPKANFKGVSASGAILGGIDLSGSNFSASYLREANFFRSDLSGADFHGADLFAASLGGANLKSADFTGASLYSSDLYRIEIDNETKFKDADLNSTCLVLNGKRVI
jgi:uncharacterized protein YjbI with pentapeptide repeats